MDENADVHAYLHSIMNLRKNYSSALECTWGYDFGQTEICTAEPVVCVRNSFEVKIDNQKRYRLLGTDQIQELIQVEGKTVFWDSQDYPLRKNFYRSEWNAVLYLFMKMMIKLISNYKWIPLH
jgi:hypothetical protein